MTSFLDNPVWQQRIFEQIKSNVAQMLDEMDAPGATVAIHIDGKLFLLTGVGYRDTERTELLTVDGKFYTYSITKTLFALAVLRLVELRQLSLDDLVHSQLPDVALGNPVTLQQLLSHTAGLPDYGRTSAYVDAVRSSPSQPWSLATFLQLAQANTMRFVPDTGWAYSNIGYLLVRRILERTLNLPLRDILQQLVFEPLALQHTFVADTLEDAQRLTPGYSSFFSGSQMQDISRFYHPGWVAHGVVVSTAPELAQIMEALFSGAILNHTLLEQMLLPAYKLGAHPLFALIGYSLGLFVDLASPYGTVGGHTGEGPGYSTSAFHFSNLGEHRVTLVTFVNQEQHDLGLRVLFAVVRTLADELPRKLIV